MREEIMTTMVDAPPSSDTARKAPTKAVAQFAPHVLRDRAKTSKTLRHSTTGDGLLERQLRRAVAAIGNGELGRSIRALGNHPQTMITETEHALTQEGSS
jgi:hypothetical protein